MYLKRNKAPKTWPLPRKGTKYLVRSSHSLKNSIPLLIVLRDMLKITGTRKELKKILNLGKVKINGKVVREERFPLGLFDNFSLENKNFKLVLKNKRFDVVEVEEKEANEKIIKINNKKIIKGSKIQINLSDGRNYLTKEKVNTGSSVVINLKENKIKEILPFREGSKIIFITGKHIGETGEIEDIDEKKKLVSVKIGKEKINSQKKNLMVIK